MTTDIKPSVTKELNEWIRTYGSERDALNVALAHLQEARAWIIAQEKCPDCFGDLSDDYVCFDCGQRWLYFGVSVEVWNTTD